MNFFDVATLPVTPWRNGGGETREIASQPAAEGFGWRASIATIAQDGPFSAFPGVDRTITLLSGDGVHLVGEGINHRLEQAGEPFEFSGDAALDCTLLGGDSRDFNIMTRRGEWTGSVRKTTAPMVSAAANSGVLYVLQGRWASGARELTTGQGVWWTAGCTAHPVGPDSVALWADLQLQ